MTHTFNRTLKNLNPFICPHFHFMQHPVVEIVHFFQTKCAFKYKAILLHADSSLQILYICKLLTNMFALVRQLVQEG